MKYKLLLAFILFSIQTTFGQYLYTTKFTDCEFVEFCLDCGETKAALFPTAANEILTSLKLKSVGNVEGRIWVQILIDTFGTPCLISAENFTNISSGNLKFAINSLSKCTPAMAYGIPRPSSVSFELVFKSGKFGMRRIQSQINTNKF